MEDPRERTPDDLPRDLVVQAMKLTGASGRRPMITRAVRDLVNRESQLAMIDWVERGGLPGITDPEVRADARR